ncbi:MAG: acetyl-CoA carboxylase, biotin carboxylase subunit [Candidatus Berkelbacteria bacterium]|nr:acetyl-CoA carboxylase, biotin carboxylase subunit [Candidatus Berkelbacteria bacterium]
MFNKILIANRGEIAVRAIRACRELGIRTVAIYEPEDADSLHVGMADEAVELKHPEPPEGVIVTRQSAYLWHYGIIAAGNSMGAEAIYPGYGYLSENPFFAEACERSSLVWIGPRSDILMYLSDKATARQLAVQTGLPVVPGSNGPVGNHEAIGIANEIGYPVMVKAARGGGGRGIRVARNEVDLLRALSQARNEAQSAFGSDQVYVEKQIPSPRHIEVQVLGDSYGHVIHLGERECSIQTPRHQKVIEESPANISPRLRRQICQAAVKLAEAIGYTNAGTVEFLVDGNGRFYFLEINTRIQVEHPVTEAVTGFDLVEAQIRIAAGEEFGSSWPGIIESHGHAIGDRFILGA